MLCQCGKPVSARRGKTGRFPAYCDDHAPKLRETLRKWREAHPEYAKLLMRNRNGSRPMTEYACSRCGMPARGYLGDGLCKVCRAGRNLVSARRPDPRPPRSRCVQITDSQEIFAPRRASPQTVVPTFISFEDDDD